MARKNNLKTLVDDYHINIALQWITNSDTANKIKKYIAPPTKYNLEQRLVSFPWCYYISEFDKIESL